MNDLDFENQKYDLNEYSKVLFFNDVVIIDEEDSGNIYLGRTEINKYILIPRVGLDIVNLLIENKNIYEVYKIISQNYDDFNFEDIIDFIKNLVELNYINKVGDTLINSIKDNSDKGFLFKLKNPKISNLIFNRFTGLIFSCFLMFTFFIYLFLFRYKFMPSYFEYFWHDSLIIVLLVSLIFDFITGITHEFFHFLASSKFTYTSSYFSIGRRLLNIVYQTRINNIWLIPRKSRYLIYFAGIILDLLIICMFMWISFYVKYNSIIYRFSRFAILYLEIGIIFQFKFYMKTDIYFFISDFLGNPSLYEDSMSFLKYIFKIEKNENDYSNVTIVYSIFILLGSIIDIFFSLYYLIPSFRYIFTNITTGGDFKIYSIITLFFSFIYYIFVLYIFLKEKTNKF